MHGELIDIETLLTELRNVNDQDHCIDCKKFSQCYKHDVGAFNEESYCKELLEQACHYLKDSSELKCLIEGCMSGEITCDECNIDIGHYRSCLRYMTGEAYERLSQWTMIN